MDDKCHVILFNKEVVLEESEQVQAITLQVTGMGCIHCANRVHNSLIDHPGIVRAEVSHMTGKAEVIYIPNKVDVSHLIGMVAEPDDGRCPHCGSQETTRLVSRFMRGRTEDDRIDEMADQLETMGEPESPQDMRKMVREMGKAMDEDASDEMEEMFEADLAGEGADDE